MGMTIEDEVNAALALVDGSLDDPIPEMDVDVQAEFDLLFEADVWFYSLLWGDL